MFCSVTFISEALLFFEPVECLLAVTGKLWPSSNLSKAVFISIALLFCVSLFFHCKVSGQMRLCCECRNLLHAAKMYSLLMSAFLSIDPVSM